MPLNPAATNVDDDAIDTLAREVAAYLATHPDAADTVDGISRWWLTRMRVEKATPTCNAPSRCSLRNA